MKGERFLGPLGPGEHRTANITPNIEWAVVPLPCPRPGTIGHDLARLRLILRRLQGTTPRSKVQGPKPEPSAECLKLNGAFSPSRCFGAARIFDFYLHLKTDEKLTVRFSRKSAPMAIHSRGLHFQRVMKCETVSLFVESSQFVSRSQCLRRLHGAPRPPSLGFNIAGLQPWILGLLDGSLDFSDFLLD